jgi:hypothetical protein
VDYRLVYRSECSDGFGVEVRVAVPPETLARIQALSNEPLPDHSLTPKEKSNCLVDVPAREIERLIRLQAAELDPDTAKKINETKKAFTKAFKDADFRLIHMDAVPNQYWGGGTPIALGDPWYIVTTPMGRFEIGWRKRVIHLDWKYTTIAHAPLAAIAEMFQDEDVTKWNTGIHAWGYEKLTRYLIKLRKICP